MFSDNKKGNQQESSAQNIIAVGTKIVGDFFCKGDLRIDGTIEGNVTASGKVVVGKSGEIIGTLKGNTAYFEGKLSGKLNLTETLTLKSSAQINGEVVIKKLAVEPGAIFNVTCVMQDAVKNIKSVQKTEKTA